MKSTKKILFAVFILCLVGGSYHIYREKTKPPKPVYDLGKITRGNLTLDVTASGTIQPINVVLVGTQISGMIERIFVDYNSVVKKNQVLAELDTFTLLEDLKSAKAQEEQAKKRRDYTRLDAARNKELFEQNYIAKAELKQAEVEAVAAQSDYEKAVAAVKKAEKNLSYAKITSPVSGTVIAREIEEGQTVAASFQTPTLFEIAEDLTKMQIETNVTEADVGLIKKGLEVSFTVDSYPTSTFTGKVSQVRLKPVAENNVVMYTVVIGIQNDDLRLLPGMTAYVDIKVQEKKDVLRVQNMALQFKPPQKGKVRKRQSNSNMARNLSKMSGLKADEAFLHILKDDVPTPVKVKKGLSNVIFTEIVSGLEEGDEVIIENLTPPPKGGFR